MNPAEAALYRVMKHYDDYGDLYGIEITGAWLTEYVSILRRTFPEDAENVRR